MRGGRTIASLCGLLVVIAAAVGLILGGARLSHPATAQAKTAGRSNSSFKPQCSDPYSDVRNPLNPLMLPQTPPATDPLGGAKFFVDGPAHGVAAGAILHLLGIDTKTADGNAEPGFSNTETYDQFISRTVNPKLSKVSASTRYDIHELEKIASQPEAQRVTAYSAGGTPNGIYSQTQKLFCHNFNADPGTIPVITTYFLHPVLHGGAPLSKMEEYDPRFESLISAMADAIGNRPVVLLLELDAVGSSSGFAKGHDLGYWEKMLGQEVTTFSKLPHAVVYLEGGYSDANTPAYAAKVLKASDISKIEGFFTNDTHLNWTSKEVAYADKVSARIGGKHFIIDTADNGRGPKLNKHPVTQGVEDLCNPPGRALGPLTTTTRPALKGGLSDARLDALMWTHVPGNSSGCGGSGPPGGVFWPAYAIGLAKRANQKLGPGYPSRPY